MHVEKWKTEVSTNTRALVSLVSPSLSLSVCAYVLARVCVCVNLFLLLCEEQKTTQI